MAHKDAEKKNSVVISGAYGLGNPGDEAILEAVLSQLKNADPEVSVTVISRDPKQTGQRFKLQSVWSFDLPKILRALGRSSLFISGGGSLIQDATSRRSMLYYLFLLKLAKMRGCRVVMYGCGIGPVKGRLMRRLARRVIASCADHITIRDSSAKEALEQLGVSGPDICVTGDPVLSLEGGEERSMRRSMAAFGLEEGDRYMLFSLRCCPDMNGKEEAVAGAADSIYAAHGSMSVFAAFTSDEKVLCERICSRMSSPCRIVSGSFGTAPLLDLIGGADAVVSSRLHLLIFAAMRGVPSAALSYDPKIEGFMRELGEGSCARLSDMNESSLTGLVEAALAADRVRLCEKTAELRARETGNQMLLDALLEKGSDSEPERPVRIAFFTSDFHVGGMQRSLVNILKRLDLSRCSADVYYIDDDFFYELPQRDGIEYIKCAAKPYWFRFVYFGILKLFSGPFAPEKTYDLAVDFNSYQNECALMAVKCRAKRRVMFVHNDVSVKLKEEPKYRVLWHFFKGKFRCYDEFAAVSTRIVESFRRCSGTKAPVWTVPNYIDTEELFKMADEDHPFQVDRSLYNLCTVGRLCHQKGIDRLLDIFAKALESRPDMHLYIIGDGPDKDALRNQARELGIDMKVSFLGGMKNPYVCMNKMDALVLTSRYEGQGMVVMEAKALGLDLFVHRDLEGCNPGIPCTDDIAAALISADRHEKRRDDLKAYNDNITRQLARVLGI